MILSVSSRKKREVIDITDDIQAQLPAQDGLVHVFVRHTTAAVTAADLDPGTDDDLLDFLDSLIPNMKWRHPHDPAHAPDHLLSSMIGPGISVPAKSGKLQLGTWQRIIFIEFNGPKNREIEITFIPRA
jgi:secondary thiamine-phosphate synthase enzyme